MSDSDENHLVFSKTSILSCLENYEDFEIGWSVLEIDFDSEHLGDAKVGVLMHTLRNNSFIRSLDLSGNNISNDSADDIGTMLKSNTTLTSLALRSNHISDSGAAALADALIRNTSLKLLHLEKNDIGDKGAREFANALRVNTSLTTLDLYYNNIGSEGGSELAKAMWANRSIRQFELGMNDLLESDLIQIAKKCDTNRKGVSYLRPQSGHPQSPIQASRDSSKRGSAPIGKLPLLPVTPNSRSNSVSAHSPVFVITSPSSSSPSTNTTTTQLLSTSRSDIPENEPAATTTNTTNSTSTTTGLSLAVPEKKHRSRSSSGSSTSRKHRKKKTIGEILMENNMTLYLEPLEALGVHEIEDISLLEESDFLKLKIKPVHKKKLLKLAFKPKPGEITQNWTDLKIIESLSGTDLNDLLKKHQMAVSVIQQEIANRQEIANECVICLEDKRTHCVVPCGHKMFCEGCVGLLDICPICRVKVKSNLKIFG